MLKKCFLGFLLFVLVAFSYGVSDAALGIPDQVQSATLIVPLMEKGISTVHNTLTVVEDLCSGSHTVHWEIWNIDGTPVNLYGNVTFNGSWVSDFGSILASASPAQLALLTDGGFYRGFMTIDLVTASTNLLPTDVGYPFSPVNCLSGLTYYVRLLEGAANGIPMIHIEGGLDAGIHSNAKGFYQMGDDREEIDNHSRYYAYLTTNGLAVVDDPDNTLNYIISRVYLTPPNGISRIVVWAWAPAQLGTTATPGSVGGPFAYQHFDEAGSLVLNTNVNLNHIVNIINVSGTANGWVWITNIPENFDVYAFSFNSATYTENPALTWEAMFESTILPEWLP
ncbi:MAG: hypothetical protein AB1442_09995 [Nitrospirota bacterium]